jgi:hypothetical protein
VGDVRSSALSPRLGDSAGDDPTRRTVWLHAASAVGRRRGASRRLGSAVPAVRRPHPGLDPRHSGAPRAHERLPCSAIERSSRTTHCAEHGAPRLSHRRHGSGGLVSRRAPVGGRLERSCDGA